MTKCETCSSKPGIVEKLVSFAKAVTSGKDENLGESRLAICLAFEYRKSFLSNKLELIPCPELERDGDKLYCHACDCPKTKLSELHNKTKYRHLECPLDKW